MDEAVEIISAHGREMSSDSFLDLDIFNLSTDKTSKSQAGATGQGAGTSQV